MLTGAGCGVALPQVRGLTRSVRGLTRRLRGLTLSVRQARSPCVAPDFLCVAARGACVVIDLAVVAA